MPRGAANRCLCQVLSRHVCWPVPGRQLPCSLIYKIVDMFLFPFCLTVIQVYDSLWQKLLKVFWWLVMAYTTLVLTAIYTFQFQNLPVYWHNLKCFADEQMGTWAWGNSVCLSSSPASSSLASSCSLHPAAALLPPALHASPTWAHATSHFGLTGSTW